MTKFGLIGFPIEHSQSPRLFATAYPEHFAQGCEDPWLYELIEEPDFEKAWARFLAGGYKAVNVTAPFKEKAWLKVKESNPEIVDEAVEACRAANILVRHSDGSVSAHNSDCLGVKKIISSLGGISSIAVIGLGGAGRAAAFAARQVCLEVRTFHHDEISAGVSADLIIYTLPRPCKGYDKLDSRYLLEANYLDPCLKDHSGYISGLEWLTAQASTGYPLFFK